MCKKKILVLFWIMYLKKAALANTCLYRGCSCITTEVQAANNKSQSNFSVMCQKSNLTNVPKLELGLLGSKPTTINFSHNRIYFIDGNSFATQTNLKKVILKNNFIEDISISAFNSSKTGQGLLVSPIELIDLRDNHLHFFPSCFGRLNKSIALLDNLEILLIGGNLFGSDIRMTSFSGVRNLKTLDLSRCLIYQISDLWFTKLNQLEFLDLSQNNIHSVSYMVFAHKVPLKILRLENNQLSHIPDNLPSCLEELYFSFNKLDGSKKECFSGLKHLTNLKNMDISFNSLKYLYPLFFDNLKDLILLDLSYNSLSVIQSGTFSGLKKLEVLFLNDNRNLSKIPDLKTTSPYQLRYIFAQRCKLKTLPISNEIQTGNKSFLKSVWLFGNPLSCDCHIKPLIKFIKANRVRLDEDVESNVTRFDGYTKRRLDSAKLPKRFKSICTRPLNRHKKVTAIPLLNVTESYLYCPDEPLYVIVACFLGIAAFLGVIPVVIILIQIGFCIYNFLKKLGLIEKKED